MYSESTVESEPCYLTVTQLARHLQVSEGTIYGWVDRDYIPFLIASDLVSSIPLQFTTGCWMKPIANVKRSKGFERYVVKWRPLLAAATGKEQ